jgi:hypothetical protein
VFRRGPARDRIVTVRSQWVFSNAAGHLKSLILRQSPDKMSLVGVPCPTVESKRPLTHRTRVASALPTAIRRRPRRVAEKGRRFQGWAATTRPLGRHYC